MSFEVNGKVLDTDEEGYLANLADWSPEVAAHMAEQDECDLSDNHWEVINFLREYYDDLSEEEAQARIRSFAEWFLRARNCVLGGNALTGDEVVDTVATEGQLPNTFVPGRNLIFLTFAAAYAYQRGIRDLVAGVCQTDYSGYPDCRQNTVEALQVAINLGMETQIRIHTPLMWMTKAETVLFAKEVGALEALAWSHTCYNGEVPPCENCPACELRAKGFVEAGLPDPLVSRFTQ